MASAERGAAGGKRNSSFGGIDAAGAAFDTHVRLIFDGHELLDDVALSDVPGLAHGSRVVALAQRRERGLCQIAVRNLVRWWPLVTVMLLAIVFVLEVSGSLPGVHPESNWRCDRPLIAYLIVCALILLPYGLILSGLYQEDRGHRLL
eukprot:3325912-Prymnesium_polylepis.1